MTTREPISIENGRVEIHAPENRVWLTRHQIADLFGVFVPAVGSNIRSILKSGILREERVYRRERNRDGGIVELYSLEMIAALAFRLKSGNAEACPCVLLFSAVLPVPPGLKEPAVKMVGYSALKN